MDEERNGDRMIQKLRTDFDGAPGHVDVLAARGRGRGHICAHAVIFVGQANHVWVTGVATAVGSRFRRARIPS